MLLKFLSPTAAFCVRMCVCVFVFRFQCEQVCLYAALLVDGAKLFISTYDILYFDTWIFSSSSTLAYSSQFAPAVVVKLWVARFCRGRCHASCRDVSSRGHQEGRVLYRLSQLRAGALLGGRVGVSSLNASDWRSAQNKKYTVFMVFTVYDTIQCTPLAPTHRSTVTPGFSVLCIQNLYTFVCVIFKIKACKFRNYARCWLGAASEYGPLLYNSSFECGHVVVAGVLLMWLQKMLLGFCLLPL